MNICSYVHRSRGLRRHPDRPQPCAAAPCGACRRAHGRPPSPTPSGRWAIRPACASSTHSRMVSCASATWRRCSRLSQSAVSHQLRLLRGLRLVRPRRDGRMVFYALDDSHVTDLLNQGLTHVGEAVSRVRRQADGSAPAERPVTAHAHADDGLLRRLCAGARCHGRPLRARAAPLPAWRPLCSRRAACWISRRRPRPGPPPCSSRPSSPAACSRRGGHGPPCAAARSTSTP